MPLLFPEDLRVAACTSIMQFSAGQQAQPESNVHSKLAVVIRSTAQLLQAFSSETWKHSAIRVLVHTSAEKTHHAQCTGACQAGNSEVSKGTSAWSNGVISAKELLKCYRDSQQRTTHTSAS